MFDHLVANEAAVRLGAFLAVFALLAILELLVPRRGLSVPKARRWTANLGIVVVNSALTRVVFPVTAVGVATLAESRGTGLLNMVDAPPVLEILVAVVALDLAIYLQHVLFHAVPALWRLHRVHHADLDFDVTTGARFHPVEILLSMIIKIAAITLLGAPAVAVVIFELALNLAAMFNHSNIRLPVPVDDVLRLLIVTPDMHRVHHSIDRRETNSNFGFNLSLWDRLLGTYRPEPAAGHANMTIGIPEFRDPAQCATLSGILSLPFRNAAAHPETAGEHS